MTKKAQHPGFVLLLFFCWLSGRAQTCTINYSYTHTDSLYTFTNISYPLDTADGVVSWSVQGPGIQYVSTAQQPTFYFPVNGLYYVVLQVYGRVSCGGYKLDTINVSGLSPSGTCQAAMTYYPTFGSQFQFNDLSTASDSIISYLWYGYSLPDTFIRSEGFTQNCVLSIWSYNNCTLPHYGVTHVITTLSGCQSVITDTLHSYCSSCRNVHTPIISLRYDSIDQQYYLCDSEAAAFPGIIYWQISVDDTVIFSQYANLYLGNYHVLHQACVNLYDTVNFCTLSGCDSFETSITTGIVPQPVQQEPVLRAFVITGPVLSINYSGNLPAYADVYDMEGRLLLSPVIKDRQTNMDLSQFATGSYILHFSSASVPEQFRRFDILK